MFKWLLLIALIFAGILSIVYVEFVETETKAVQDFKLSLEEPAYEWVRPSADGTELCLGSSDFIKHQMYMEGLKHEAQR